MTIKKQKKKYRILNIFKKIALGLIFFFVVLILFIRSSWGQNIIVDEVTSYISKKTNSKIALEKLFITFSGNIALEGLYLEDKKGDTLIYSKNLEASIAFAPLIRGEKIHIKSLTWDGLTLNIERKEATTAYNFDFLIDALVSEDPTNISEKKKEATLLIQIGTADFSDFNISYNDEVTGIESTIALGNFELELHDEIDITQMQLHIKNVAIAESKISYNQYKPFVEETNTSDKDSLQPSIRLDQLQLDNVKIAFKSIPDKITTDLQIGNFILEVPKADLTNQIIALDKLALSNSKIYLNSIPEYKAKKADTIIAMNPASYDWGNWNIQGKHISLENNTITLQTGNKEPKPGLFNPEFIAVDNVNVIANNIYLTPEKAEMRLEKMSFKERSGFMLKDFTVELKGNNTSLQLNALHIATNTNTLQGASRLNFNSIDQFINHPELAKIHLNVNTLRLNPVDAYFFQPLLSQNEYIKILQTKDIFGKLELHGTLDTIQIPIAKLHWGEETSVIGSGSIRNLTEVDRLFVDIKELNFKTNKAAISQFIVEEDLGLSIPEYVQLQGTAKGGLSNITTNATLKIPEGIIGLKGTLKNKKSIAFNGMLNVQQLHLGTLLKNEQLGVFTFNTKVSGKGTSLNTLDASLTTEFSKLEFNTYDFSNLSLEGKIVNGKGSIDARFKDENLDFLLNTQVLLDTIASDFTTVLDLRGADLKALGITRDAIKTKFKLIADFEGNTTNFNLTTDIREGLVVYDTKTYPFDDISLNSKIQENNTKVALSSQSINSKLVSNTNPTALLNALESKLQGYFKETVIADTITTPIQMRMDIAIHPSPVMKEVFLKGLKESDTLIMNVDFDESKNHFQAAINAPLVQYKDSNLNDLEFFLKAGKENLQFNLGFKKLASDPLLIKDTYLEGEVSDKKLLLSFNAFDEKDKLVHLESEITMINDTIRYHLNPSELILNKKKWEIPSDNKVLISDNLISFENFELHRNNQLITLSSSIPGEQKEHIGVVFENFKLSSFTSFLNTDESLANGVMKGDFIVENPFKNSGLIADLSIESLKVMEAPLGNLILTAETKGLSNYDIDLTLKGGNVDLDLDGTYEAIEGKLDLDILLNDFKIQTIERFATSYVSNTSGSISGQMKLSGTTLKPIYSGALNFNKTAFSINALNTKFTLPDETIKIDNSGIFVDNFIVLDNSNNSFILDGKVTTEDITNPKFNVSLKAKEIQVINSKKENNDLFYGNVNLNADMRITGDLQIPKIEGSLKINENSDFTYIVPESELDVVEREGVLIFVNKKEQNAILTRADKKASSSTLKGFDINTTLSIDKEAIFHIIIDERTGDNLQISGTGDFNLGLEPNGRTTLSGRYQVQQGHYEVSLYNLVKKKFKIAKGGTIIWRGDPLDAEMDIRAIYEVETAASGLMATRTSGEPTEVINKFRQKLPFLVYLNVKGELLKPEISFNLDIPEDRQGELGGEVYSQVQQLNTREEELNKQVFSLLVLNQFFPSSTSDGSSGGSISIARDNVNRVLANQLNNFSNKIIGGESFELDFDLDSYTDYQGTNPQDRTQLDINARKRFFNDRLIVQVGSGININENSQNSGQNTPVIGNVSLEYTITENGRYRLKGFRKNEFESVIDGQVIVTGIAFIFNREFNKFRELWTKTNRKEAREPSKKKNEKK